MKMKKIRVLYQFQNIQKLWYNINMGIIKYDKLIKESVEELEELLKKEKDARIY
jgi:hypothetical protein